MLTPSPLGNHRCTYLCGNSLGPLAKRSKSLVLEELHVWGSRCVAFRGYCIAHRESFPRAVEGHFKHPYGREWMDIADTVTPLLAELVGEFTLQKYIHMRFPGSDICILRRSGERSCLYGHLDCESASHDVSLLQAHLYSLQDPLRRQSFPLGSSGCTRRFQPR
jgi:hypothetical protein